LEEHIAKEVLILDVLYVMRNIWGGGAPRRFWEIHKLLVTKGLNVTLLATPDASTYQRFEARNFPGIKIIPVRIPKSPFSDYLFYFKAMRIVRRIAKNFDIIHDDFSPMAPYSFLWHPNTVATIYEVFGKNALKRYGIAGLAPLANERLYQKMRYKFVITCTPSMERELEKLGVHSEVVPLGVDPTVYVPSKKNTGKGEEEIAISNVARFTPLKGHICFIKVAKKLLREQRNVKFVLPGTGPLLPKIEGSVSNLRIEFPGYVNERDKIKILQGSDIFLNTSFQEGFGISVCEAMACQLPVVAFDVPGVRDLVTPSCGFLVPPGEIDLMIARVKELIENDSLRKEMGRRARERVLEFFTWQRAAERIFEIYSSV
jgi:glycogen(starch) synthase